MLGSAEVVGLVVVSAAMAGGAKVAADSPRAMGAANAIVNDFASIWLFPFRLSDAPTTPASCPLFRRRATRACARRVAPARAPPPAGRVLRWANWRRARARS